MTVFNDFTRIIENRHTYAQDWATRTGSRIIGWLCTYTPEEIIYAAGMLPVKIVGAHEPEGVTSANLYSMYCSHCRDLLAQGLQGRYDYLSGLVHGYSCIHIRQTYDSWTKHLPLQFHHMVYVPERLEFSAAKVLVTKEIDKFKNAVETWTGQTISAEALEDAIQVYNTNRQLLNKLYQLQKKSPPPLSGVELLDAVASGQVMDKREHNRLLEEAIAEASGRQPTRDVQTRIMLIGSAFDDPEVIRLVESTGAAVVVDDNCVGTRYFLGEVGSGPDPIAALADRYVSRKPLCPVKDMSDRYLRISHILSLAKEYAVTGVVFVRTKFCDPLAHDVPSTIQALEAEGIPSLNLECDMVNPLGQFRTRVEAFAEMLEV